MAKVLQVKVASVSFHVVLNKDATIGAGCSGHQDEVRGISQIHHGLSFRAEHAFDHYLCLD